MNYVATITSKNQLTIPIGLVKKVGLMVGQKMSVSEADGRLILTPMERLVEELAGSLSIPKRWQGKDVEEIIEEAKREYFRQKYATNK